MVRRVLHALRHPKYAIHTMLRELTWADERFLAQAVGAKASAIRAYLNEPYLDRRLAAHLDAVERELSRAVTRTAEVHAKKVLLQYAVVRSVRARRVVETGVANGISTTYLLHALAISGAGRLYSVDIGDDSVCPPGKHVGWAVPHWLVDRWELHLGDAREVLPRLLDELGEIDVFIHDSLHTEEHMLFEFSQAWAHLRPGGVLIADDATWNAAFACFIADRAACWVVTRGVGIAVKPF